MNECSADGCPNPRYRRRRYCSGHVQRLAKTGSLGTTPIAFRATTPEQIWRAYVVPTGFCWYWTGQTNGRYGHLRAGRSDRTRIYAHRWAYEQLVGPIPAGLEIDHLCFNVLCVNPDHLEPVTTEENIERQKRRHQHGEFRPPVASRQNLCARMLHPLEGENVLYEKGGTIRRCRACRNESRRAAYARRAV